MREQLLNAWRARRVLLICAAGYPGQFMQAMLSELGARPARLSPGADAAQLNQAMTLGRISAVIVPDFPSSPFGSLPVQLTSLLSLLAEAREAGVPLVMLCSDVNVYRTDARPWASRENDPIGGETREELIQSILQLAADGVSRGLLGDAVSTLIIRHPPCLGCGHPAVKAYTGWCSQLRSGEVLTVDHPAAAGLFLHPLDICCGALALGARFLLGDRNTTGAFNLGAAPENLIANRTAALRFIRENGGKRPIREQHCAAPFVFPRLDDSKARLLCGIRYRIHGHEALNQLYALQCAQDKGLDAQIQAIRSQTKQYLQRIE